MTHSKPAFSTTIFPIAIFLILAVPVGTAHAGKSPEVKCAQTVAKAIAGCVKKAVILQTVCYKKGAAECIGLDTFKVQKAYDNADKKIQKKCLDAAMIDGAGYAPLEPVELAAHFATTCQAHATAITRRTFSPDGSAYVAADADGQVCLQKTGKEAAKLVAKGAKTLAKCAGVGCAAAGIDPAVDFPALAAKAVKKIDKSCVDLSALTGMTSVAYADVAVDHIAPTVASPCSSLDESRCMFPMPSDYYTIPDTTNDSGRRVMIGATALPANDDGDHVVPGPWNTVDGASIGPMIIIANEDIDIAMTGVAPITDLAAALDPNTPVIIFDALTGEQQLLWVERDEHGATAADQAIIGRVGKNLLNGRRYIVAMRGMKDVGGVTLAASTTFAAYRDATPTTSLPIEAHRAHMEEIFTTLTGFGITRGDLYLAWDFTTQSSDSTSSRHLAMRDDAFDNILGPSAPSFTVDTVTEPLDAAIFRQVDGTFQVPLYMTLNGIPGSSLRVDKFDVPFNSGDFFTANYRCIIPNAATTGGGPPAVPARPSLYGHGLLGTGNQTSSSHVRDFASEHNFVMCGTDWTGFASEDTLVVLGILNDFSAFPPFIDRQHQGVLNFQVLGRLLTHASGFASDPAFQVGGQSVIDPNELFYDGNSQGGILGGVLAAISQHIERFVLGVPGINYSTLLNRSVDFSVFADQLDDAYPSSMDRSILFGIGQILWDRTDPSGHINHLTFDPYPGTPAKKILYQVAYGDHQVAPVTAEIASRTIGALLHTPALPPTKVQPEVTPQYDIAPIVSYPHDGSAIIIYDSGNPAPPLGNTAPVEITAADPEWADLFVCAMNHGSDPHECPRRQPAARLQKSEFLKTGGAVVDVCGGAACLAPLD
jgi:hypothetical protein